MIRRDTLTSAGLPGWMLISQVDHARLAFDLAHSWGRDPFAELAPRWPLLAAVLHHDDGWRAWEARPEVDHDLGRPYDFTEMPLQTALNIWRQSIQVSAQRGPLTGWLVSGHFCALLRRFTSGWQSDAARASLAQAFLAEQQPRQAAWLDYWSRSATSEAPESVAQRALAFLQFFDGLSLWICCAQRTAPWQTETPGGQTLTITPETPTRLRADPWPWRTPSLELRLAGRVTPAIHYSGQQEFAAAPSQWRTLGISLLPSHELSSSWSPKLPA